MANRFSKILIVVLLASTVLPSAALAALTFGAATTDVVNHGSDASLDNLNPFTWAAWIFPTTLTNARIILSKATAGSVGKQFAVNGTAGDVSVRVNRPTDTVYITNDTPLATTSKWYFIAATFDSAGAAGQVVNIYVGDLTTSLAERAYGTATDGSGTPDAEETVSFAAGNLTPATPATPLQGRIAWAGVWNRGLSLGELQQQQFRPHKTSGNVLFTHYGFNGTGTQPDWSGTGNSGTVTGATQSDHVPLGAPFGTDDAAASLAVNVPPLKRFAMFMRRFYTARIKPIVDSVI